MSNQPQMSVTLKTAAENKEFVKTALTNAGVLFTVEPEKRPQDPLKLMMVANIASISILLQILSTKPEAYSGEVTLADGQNIMLDETGKAQLNEMLQKTMSQPQPYFQQAPSWWMYFLPEIKGILKEIGGLVRWYPRAVGEGQYLVARNFLLLIIAILVGVWILTFYGRVSGDAFVFVVGIMLGYVFSFLQKYLGLSAGGD